MGGLKNNSIFLLNSKNILIFVARFQIRFEIWLFISQLYVQQDFIYRAFEIICALASDFFDRASSIWQDDTVQNDISKL